MCFINCAIFKAYHVYNSVNTTKVRYKLYSIARIWFTSQVTEQSDPNQPGSSGTQHEKGVSKYDPPMKFSQEMKTKIILLP